MFKFTKSSSPIISLHNVKPPESDNSTGITQSDVRLPTRHPGKYWGVKRPHACDLLSNASAEIWMVIMKLIPSRGTAHVANCWPMVIVEMRRQTVLDGCSNFHICMKLHSWEWSAGQFPHDPSLWPDFLWLHPWQPHQRAPVCPPTLGGWWSTLWPIHRVGHHVPGRRRGGTFEPTD